jgi:hypothetical protein
LVGLREAKMQQLIPPESETEVARTTALSKEALDSVVAVTHVSDPLVRTQSDFIRKVVGGAGGSLSRPDGRQRRANGHVGARSAVLEVHLS